MTTNEQLSKQRARRCSANDRTNDIRFDEALYIRELQTYLRALETDEEFQIVPDGIFGPETEAAVRRFQNLTALNETGVADFTTWTQIVESFRYLSEPVWE